MKVSGRSQGRSEALLVAFPLVAAPPRLVRDELPPGRRPRDRTERRIEPSGLPADSGLGRARGTLSASCVEEIAVPVIADRVVLRAWRHKNQPSRIHFIVRRADGTQRRLWVGEGRFMYEILDSHLLALGYTGPASADADPDEAEPAGEAG
jgi:hypothetical protein